MSTYKEELRSLLSEGYKLADAHKKLREQREQEESEVEISEEKEKPEVEAEIIDSANLKVGDKLPCPNCGNPVGITINYINNQGKRGLHCYQCGLTFKP